MGMLFRLDDYMDQDTAYLTGLLIGRGIISESSGIRQLIIEFSHSSLSVEGISSSFSLETAIRLGLDDVRERLQELLDTDIRKVPRTGGVDLVIRFMRNSMIWRNILLLTEGASSYPHFRVPSVFFDPTLPKEWKREFVRGYADVAGNIRHANRYLDKRNRVRLDVLNYPTNWEVPVQLCRLLQEQLGVPVQLITWGHPNMGRDFREHQLNIFAEPFLAVGFSLEYKQRILEEFVEWDKAKLSEIEYRPCPGIRKNRARKPDHPDEKNGEKLDHRLNGCHFDSYWQICKALGCERAPRDLDQTLIEFSDEVEASAKER